MYLYHRAAADDVTKYEIKMNEAIVYHFIQYNLVLEQFTLLSFY